MRDVFSMQDVPVRERIQRIIRGLKAPKDSGDRKYAILALERIFGPSTISITVAVITIIALASMATSTINTPPEIEVEIIDPTSVDLDKLEIPEEIIPPDKIEPLDQLTPDQLANMADAQNYSGASDVGIGVDNAGDATLVPMAAVMTKSPLILRGLYGNRSGAGRAAALRAYRKSGASQETEDAVLRALRWLKRNQKEDGSWAGEEASAMTGFALLCYLAHGETPTSPEFGPTVEKAIKFLIAKQGTGTSFSPNAYAHGIATYAMSEAFAMTKNLAIKESMEKGIQRIIEGQQQWGGFDYGYAKTPRWDTSVTGWQVQALKAAKMAGAQNEGIDQAIQKASLFLKSYSFNPNSGSFSYSANGPVVGPGGSWTMTGVGVLCLQLIGEAKDMAVKAGLTFLEKQTMKWNKEGKNAVYGWYYLTQANFQEGGSRWDAWDKIFSNELVNNQLEDGHWEGGDHGKEVYTTTLCCLMLEVYYRYLPTYQKIDSAPAPKASSDDDVQITVSG